MIQFSSENIFAMKNTTYYDSFREIQITEFRTSAIVRVITGRFTNRPLVATRPTFDFVDLEVVVIDRNPM